MVKHYKDTQNQDQLDRSFHALSDPNRRCIIELLREADELKIGNIAEAFSMSLNGVSKHVKVLERANLVHRRIKGREHFIAVNWVALQKPYEWLHFYHHFWSHRIDQLIDYVSQNQKGEKNE